MGLEARKLVPRPTGHARVAPDPLAAVLPALSALGAIASIAAILWVGETSASERQKPRRKIAIVVRDLESDCLKLQDIFRRLARSLTAFGNDRAIVSSPFKFGLNALKSDSDTQHVVHVVLGDIARVLPSASGSAFEVMCAIEDGLLDAPESVFFGFGDAQERLNKLLTERASLKATVEGGLEIADRLTALVRELKRHVRE